MESEAGLGAGLAPGLQSPQKLFHELPHLWCIAGAGLMGFDCIPLGPLSPLRIINDMVK
jgi:hypothetical protein